MVLPLVAPAFPANSTFASPEYQEILARLRKAQMAPRPAYWAERLGWEMGLVHAFMLDMFERLYAFAEYAVEQNDLDNYLGFADTALGHLHFHHHFEEDVMFPRIEEACNDTAHNLTKNVEQHAGFAAQLNAAWLYVRACRSNLSPPPKASPVPPPTEEELRADPADHGLDPKLGFQPQAFRAEMDKWLLPLAVHLEEEIVTLDPKWIEKMGEPEFIRQGKATEKYLQSYDPAWFLVSAIGSMPDATAARLIALPMPVRKIMLPLLWAPKYSDYWKYCSHPENLNFW